MGLKTFWKSASDAKGTVREKPSWDDWRCARCDGAGYYPPGKKYNGLSEPWSKEYICRRNTKYHDYCWRVTVEEAEDRQKRLHASASQIAGGLGVPDPYRGTVPDPQDVAKRAWEIAQALLDSEPPIKIG